MRVVRCPQCSSSDDRVVDSRSAEDGTVIRRRRECTSCSRRFTTYERLEEAPLLVLKRSGGHEPFDRRKIVSGVTAAAKNRPIPEAARETLAAEVEEELRIEGSEVTSERVGWAVLARLRDLDEVAYLRFASVYKGFTAAGDFEREAGLLVEQILPGSP